MEQQTPIPPQIKDEAARRVKRAIFPSLIWGEGGGLGLPFILSKIVGSKQAHEDSLTEKAWEDVMGPGG